MIPTPIIEINDAIAIAAGAYHTLAVRADHTVAAWGLNTSHQLGDNSDAAQQNSPVSVFGLNDAMSVAAGFSYSIAVKADGTIVAWGSNVYGQLGQENTFRAYPTPTAISGIVGATVVAGGWDHALALTQGNGLLAWGASNFGQLGLAGVLDSNTHIAVSAFHSTSFGVAASPTFTPAAGSTLQPGSTVTMSSATPNATIHYATNNDPTIDDPAVASGGGVSVQHSETLMARTFADGWEPSPLAQANFTVTGKVDAIRLTPDGGCWNSPQVVMVACATEGAEIHYTLDGTAPTQLSPAIASGTTLSVIPPATLQVAAWKSGLSPSEVKFARYFSTMPSAAANATLAAGDHHSIAALPDGTVWTWGSNNYGQAGVQAPNVLPSQTKWAYATPVQAFGLTSVIAVAAGYFHCLALKADGSVWAWGYNGSGQLGNGSTVSQPSPVQVTALTDVIGIAAGYDHSIALKRDGTVWTWGNNDSGQVGGDQVVNPTPIQVGAPLTGVVQVAAGSRHSLALSSDGTVYSWGQNDSGQLGNGSTTGGAALNLVSDLSDVIAIAAHGYYSLALKSDGSLRAWGSNSAGQLGDGSGINQLTPVSVAVLTSGVAAIAAGDNHALAIKTDGSLWAWGYDEYGELGNSVSTVVNSSVASATPIPVASLNSGVVAVAAGAYHSLALKNSGAYWAFGNNSFYTPLGAGAAASNVANPVPIMVAFDYKDSNDDGLLDWQAREMGLNPYLLDSNSDGLADKLAIDAGISPSAPGQSFTGIPSPTPPINGPGPDPSDHTPPTITLLQPVGAVPVQ